MRLTQTKKRKGGDEMGPSKCGCKTTVEKERNARWKRVPE